MNSADIIHKVEEQLRANRPMAIWRNPQAQNVQCLFQKNNKDYRFAKTGQSGFIATDFWQSHRYLIPQDQAVAFSFSADHFVDQFHTSSGDKTGEPQADQAHYFKMINQAIQQLQQSDLEKIVLSHPVNVSSNKSILSVFSQLLKHYPDAFVYLWFHPQTGIWLGATPETLVDIKDNRLKTMALAGTQTADKLQDVTWHNKEIREQQYVVDAMAESLKKYTTNLQICDRKTSQAGHLYHLQTDFQAQINNDQLPDLLNDLHPTPAVCGIPKKQAQDLIRQYENYSRDLYTGYLGYINAANDRLETKLHVNLRCMQKNPLGYTLFVGGGITADSDPQQEWEETLSKAQTMLMAL